MRAKAAPQAELLFYDGGCGLCHRVLRLVLAEENGRTLFRFAPLKGDTFDAEVPIPIQDKLPDSLLVKTADGEFLMRTNAVCHILLRLGGGWLIAGKLLSFIPTVVRDWGYDTLARVRHRLFQRPANVCPLLPEALRNRFEL